MTHGDIVLAITGASGSIYAIRLIQNLLAAGLRLHVVISNAARQVSARELGTDFPNAGASDAQWSEMITTALSGKVGKSWGFQSQKSSVILPTSNGGMIRSYATADYSSGIASGSFPTSGMVICPCSMGTLSAIATGASTNLIQRAADVHLKEKRPLILVPRETPLGLIQLENMTRLAHAGATIMPSMPGFYHQPKEISDLVDFVVARILDHLKVKHTLIGRWGTD